MLTDRGPTRSFKAIQATAMVAGKVFLLLGMDREKGALCAPVARWWDTQRQNRAEVGEAGWQGLRHKP
jgi:hypothetical protein